MNRRYIFIVCAALAAVVAAYLMGRANVPSPAARAPDAAGGVVIAAGETKVSGRPRSAAGKPAPAVATGAPLPPLDTPLKDAFSELQARANAGDAVAATRLVHDLSRCSRLRGSEWKNTNASDDLTAKKTEGMSPEQLRTYQLLLDAMEIRQQSVKKNQDLCAGVSGEMLDSMTPNIQQAAQLGDADARACYLGRGPLFDTRNLLDHPESLGAYRNSAQSMIDAGLAAGDWKVVDLLQNAYEPGAQSLLAGLVGGDPYQHYRYLKLYRLGAEEFRVPKLEQQLAAAAANLSPAQVAEADEWAQTTLQQNFSGNSTSAAPEQSNPCALLDN
jgi:hypothetical protein